MLGAAALAAIVAVVAVVALGRASVVAAVAAANSEAVVAAKRRKAIATANNDTDVHFSLSDGHCPTGTFRQTGYRPPVRRSQIGAALAACTSRRAWDHLGDHRAGRLDDMALQTCRRSRAGLNDAPLVEMLRCK